MLYSIKKSNKIANLKIFNKNKNIKIEIKSKIYNIEDYEKLYLSDKVKLSSTKLCNFSNIFIKKDINGEKEEQIKNIIQKYKKEGNIITLVLNNACDFILGENQVCLKKYTKDNYYYNRIIELGIILKKLKIKEININGFMEYLLFKNNSIKKENLDDLISFLSAIDDCNKIVDKDFIEINILRNIIQNNKNNKNIKIKNKIKSFIYKYYDIELSLDNLKEYQESKNDINKFNKEFVSNYLEQNSINKSLLSDLIRKNRESLNKLYNFYKKQNLNIQDMINIFNYNNKLYFEKGYILNIDVFNKNIEIAYSIFKKQDQIKKKESVTNKYQEVKDEDF